MLSEKNFYPQKTQRTVLIENLRVKLKKFKIPKQIPRQRHTDEK